MCYIMGHLLHSNDIRSDFNGLVDDLLKVNDADNHVNDGDDGHSFQSWIHGLHEDVEVTVVLGLALDVSFHVESVDCFDINFTGWCTV